MRRLRNAFQLGLVCHTLLAIDPTPVHAAEPMVADQVTMDPSCSEVNDAYAKSRAYPRYSTQMPLIKPDGTVKPFMEWRFTETEEAAKYVFQKTWKRDPRSKAPLADVIGPKFTDCKIVAAERSDAPNLHYKARWHQFTNAIDTDILISRDSGMLSQVTRRYPDDRPAFPEKTVVEIFSYDPVQ